MGQGERLKFLPKKLCCARYFLALLFVVTFVYHSYQFWGMHSSFIPETMSLYNNPSALNGKAGECLHYGCVSHPDTYEHINTSSALTKKDLSLVTRQSNQHSFNQDEALIIPKFHTHQNNDGLTLSFMVGIFDGHGHDGHVVARNVAINFPRILAEKLNYRTCCQSDEWIVQQMKDTFLQVNEELSPFAAMRGGCTASVSFRLGSKLFVANAGDSRTILARNSEIVYSSRRDKAHLPEERARIESMGGKIHIPVDFPNGSRVTLYSAAAKPPEVIGLAMSRSIGDWEWKEVGVTAEPLVDVLEWQPGSFLIAASDGIWDMRKPEFFVNRFSNAKVTDSPSKIASDIIRDVSPKYTKWYRDDMTIAYIR